MLEGVERSGIGRPTVEAAQAASGAVPEPRTRITRPLNNFPVVLPPSIGRGGGGRERGPDSRVGHRLDGRGARNNETRGQQHREDSDRGPSETFRNTPSPKSSEGIARLLTTTRELRISPAGGCRAPVHPQAVMRHRDTTPRPVLARSTSSMPVVGQAASRSPQRRGALP